jgi:uncharacterized membrane protein YsdA (DUF1294 family)
MLVPLLVYLLLINLLTLVAFRSDKMAARRGLPRVPEIHLLWLAAMGGTGGAYAGRRLWRHKTRKQPFSAQLHGIASLQLLLLGAMAWQFG